jgi:UDP-2,3-diacylglucosamine hydrolase
LLPSNLLNEVVLSGADAALFVSDIHLCDDEPDIATLFFEKLEQWLEGHSHLFILGDLFESWCGDDAADSMAAQLIAKLKNRSEAGLKIYVMRGNRDFLIDQPITGSFSTSISMTKALTTQIGAALLADECVMNNFGERWLLCHGDQLCTLDLAYQTFRKQSRSPKWQHMFLSQPKETRLEQAKQMRAASRQHQLQGATQAMYDVEQQAVDTIMAHFSATHLLHGHTHKPAVHALKNNGQRWVLSDWATHPVRGDALSIGKSGIKRLA